MLKDKDAATMEPEDSDAGFLRPPPFKKILTFAKSTDHEYVDGLLSDPAMLRVARVSFFFFLRSALRGLQ